MLRNITWGHQVTHIESLSIRISIFHFAECGSSWCDGSERLVTRTPKPIPSAFFSSFISFLLQGQTKLYGMRLWLIWSCLVTHFSCQLHLLRLKITSVLSVSCEHFSPKFYLVECGYGWGWCGLCVWLVTHISKPITSAIYVDIRHHQEVYFFLL